MNKGITGIIALAICFFAFLVQDKKQIGYEGMMNNLSARKQQMFKMLVDPNTGKVPDAYRQAELAFAATLPSDLGQQKFANWESIGPYNIGGRTRSLAIDVTDPNILMAGAATGGIWRSTNGGVSWYLTDMAAVPTANITSLIQDKRSGRTKNWWASSGELYGGSIPGAFYNGSGIYKSTNGGQTWVKAGNVSTGLGGLSGAWSVVHRIAINPAIDSVDVIYAANFDGIFRSINGGSTWIKVRGGNSQAVSYSYFTDVAITSTGVVYATLSGGGQQQGIWRSADNGKTWANITPVNFQSSCNRIAIGIAPSDEKQVYFIANSPGQGKESKNFEGTPEYNSLWKYTYISGDGSGAGGAWSDRSNNIPGGSGGFFDYISQGGYCLEVNVKPDDANTVFIGGTNLFRSTDGFSSNNNIAYVGGYAIGTTLPDFKLFPNHHPDNHGVVFYPNNPAKMISIHDGGISRTNNCLGTPMEWESLNKGFVSTQFYTITQDHGSSSKLTIGGLQDNGTLLSLAGNSTENWTMPLSYDGSYAFIKPGGTEAYLSIQQGRMQRMILNASGIPTQMTRIDPKGVNKADYQFINPFTPDANDFKVLYTPAGNVIWRNSDITAIPLKNQLDSNASAINWTKLYHTQLTNAGDEITAVYSSKSQANVLYYGTAKGKLYRLRQTADTASLPENITGSNFPAAYINCITQDPRDSSVLFAVFTNYAVLSVFQSVNGGASWTAISGNLEQSANGAGTGPSCRWLTLAPTLDSMIYFLGTSTGLYATKSLNGMQTVWTRQGATTIGTQIVTMMDHRPQDGRMVVATYGSGVYQSYVQSLNPKTGLNQWQREVNWAIYPNPATDYFDVQLPNDIKVKSYQVFDLKGAIMMQGPLTHNTRIELQYLPSGTYIFQLETEQGKLSRRFIKK